MKYKTGDILLLAFPYSDGSTVKRRPALVLADTGDDDIIVARITSQKAQSKYDVDIIDWQQAGLKIPSIARLHKIATLEKKLIDRKLESLTSDDLSKINSAFLKLCEFITKNN